MFQPIKNEKLSEKIVREIMEQIKSGEIKPGDKLPTEMELSDALGVSRGILREALTVLQARNYIIRKPKEGTFVNLGVKKVVESAAGISLKEATYMDLIEMRECIEQREVEKIIETADDKEIEELAELMNETISPTNSGSVDYYFHYRMAELSRNIMFVNFIDTYYDVINELTEMTTKKSERIEEIYQEHQEILNAIVARDKEAAKMAVIKHLQNVKKNIKGIQ